MIKRPMNYSFGIVRSCKQLAADNFKMLPIVKSGSLRFCGGWFGKPYDNWHVVVSCDATDDCLQIHFNQGEVLAVWNPVRLEIDAKQFRMAVRRH